MAFKKNRQKGFAPAKEFDLGNGLHVEIVSLLAQKMVFIEGVMTWTVGGVVTVEDAETVAREYDGSEGALKFAKIVRDQLAEKVEEVKKSLSEMEHLQSVSKKIVRIL